MTKPLPGDGGLILRVRVAYWVALLIVAAMTAASYFYLHLTMAAHQADDTFASLAGTQKALSQRIVYLSNAAHHVRENDRSALLQDLSAATADFVQNQERLLAMTNGSGRDGEDSRLGQVLFEEPYQLDRYSRQLIADAGRGDPDPAVASATMSGFEELQRRGAARTDQRFTSMLATYDSLFFGKLALLLLVGMFIFQPLTNVIRRKTQELIDAHDSMAQLAIHDRLTGLYNRSFLIDHFDTVLKGARRRRERFAVLQVDLDRFKQINDTLGHAAGDFVLVKTAERMRDSCRASDLCVRLGGDEFVMVLGAVGTSQDIAMVVRRILTRINEPLNFEGVTIHPGASAGIAVYPVDAEAGTDLLVDADLALYSAKKLGGGHFSFFSDELRRELEHRKQLETDLRAAIADRTFIAYFQPQISLSDGSIAGVEALIRWKHPERGLIPPGEFLPVAEKTGLMAEIGRIVISKAIRQAAEWHCAGLSFGRLAVNVSGAELREADFVEFLLDTLAKAGLPPQKLAVEIVESVILDDEKSGIAAKLRRIRAAGIRLELDDFGTGYASLAHVNPNEIDRLKIDRRFVQKVDTNRDNSQIVRAITELARGLGISIIAEGAETEEELACLLEIGCEHVQGYSVAFPMPQTDARDWLAAHSPKRSVLRVREGLRA